MFVDTRLWNPYSFPRKREPLMKSLFLVGVVCLAMGFVLGRLFPVAASSPPERVTPGDADPPRTSTASTPSLDVGPGREGQNSTDAVVHRERMDALRWIAASGVPMQMRTFSGSEINPMLVRLLGLNESESARLKKAYAQAQSEIDAIRSAQAKPTRSPDGARLLIEAPGLDPVASGRIYDRFSAEFKSTLGPDRTAMFEQISGAEGYEQALDRFGLNPVRYELELRPVATSGEAAIYEYKRHHLNPMGASLSATSVRLSLTDIRKRDPLLSAFIPPSPGP